MQNCYLSVSLSKPICNPLGLLESVSFAAYIQGLPVGNLPCSYQQSPFCWQTKQFLMTPCAQESTKGTCLDSAHVCIATVHPHSLTAWTETATLTKHVGVAALRFQSPSDPGRPFYQWERTCPNAPFKSPTHHTQQGHPFTWPGFLCLSTYVVTPLVNSKGPPKSDPLSTRCHEANNKTKVEHQLHTL